MQAMGALITDLHDKGLLDQTLVVLASEFGRMSRINDNDGRGHQNREFTGTTTATTSNARHLGQRPSNRPLSRYWQTSMSRGCWNRRWWCWAPSSAAHLGSTTTTGPTRPSGHVPAGRGWDQQDYVIGWDTHSDNFEGTQVQWPSWTRR